VPERLDSVFRRLVLEAAGHPWMRRLTTRTAPGRALAGRFVAGETLEEAMQVSVELAGRRITAMLDHLGENVATPVQAEAARDDYLAALGAIRGAPSLDAAVSVKLTQLGLDDSIDACLENLEPILDVADELGTFLMIDMESHPYVEATLEVLRRAHERSPRVGVAIQSYLRRSQRDVFHLPAGCRVRLVKGAYLEPPDIVYVDKDDVDASYARLFTTLLARGHAVDVATHDPRLIDGVRTMVDASAGGWSRVEFQMLYGVRRDLQDTLAGRGYPVRVYVPYGTEWYPYLTRRMAERPANLWFFLSNLVRTR
jgi:proline dehydrogenase